MQRKEMIFFHQFAIASTISINIYGSEQASERTRASEREKHTNRYGGAATAVATSHFLPTLKILLHNIDAAMEIS